VITAFVKGPNCAIASVLTLLRIKGFDDLRGILLAFEGLAEDTVPTSRFDPWPHARLPWHMALIASLPTITVVAVEQDRTRSDAISFRRSPM